MNSHIKYIQCTLKCCTSSSVLALSWPASYYGVSVPSWMVSKWQCLLNSLSNDLSSLLNFFFMFEFLTTFLKIKLILIIMMKCCNYPTPWQIICLFMLTIITKHITGITEVFWIEIKIRCLQLLCVPSWHTTCHSWWQCHYLAIGHTGLASLDLSVCP